LNAMSSRERQNMFECVKRSTEENIAPQMFAVSTSFKMDDISVSCRFSPAELPLDGRASVLRPTSQCLAPHRRFEPPVGFPPGHLYFVMAFRTGNPKASGSVHRKLPVEKRKVPLSPFEDVRVISLVGSGAFGTVYLGRWGGTHVALKAIRSSPEEKSKGHLEACLAASISHSNLVQTFKHCESTRAQDGTTNYPVVIHIETWIVQEWCDGGTLRSICIHPRADAAGLEEAMDIGMEIADAVAYLHDRGLVHGDLTTNNVLRKMMPTPKGYVCKVGDFGLSRIFNDKEEVVTNSLGTVSHMPPELFSEDAVGFTLTPKVDVYSFARILYEVLTGQRPFDGLSPAQIVMQVAKGACMRLTVPVPSALEAMYLRCLAPDPEERPRCSELVVIMETVRHSVFNFVADGTVAR